MRVKKLFLTHLILGGLGSILLVLALIFLVLKLTQIGMGPEISWAVPLVLGLGGIGAVTADSIIFFKAMFD